MFEAFWRTERRLLLVGAGYIIGVAVSARACNEEFGI
jgi:hypothetical protein